MNRAPLAVALASSILWACSSPSEPPASPVEGAEAPVVPAAEAPAAEAEAATAPEAADQAETADQAEAAQEQAPRQVLLGEVEIRGEGLDEETVRGAYEALSTAYEECYSVARETTPDAAGRMLITLLYIDGQRRSVAASYSGPGAADLNECFREASRAIELAPPADSGRTVVVLRLLLEPAP